MAPSKIRKALGAVKDQTSISLAKVSNSNTASELDVAIVKATRHDEAPAEEKHIREILCLTCYSRNYVSACVNTLSRRLGKTRNWTVALKTLILIHRLLSEGDSAYEQEIFFTTRRGTRMLNMSEFRDASRSGAWDFSAFVRTYALYLDERLEYRMHGRKGRRSRSMGEEEVEEEEEVASSSSSRATPVREMKSDRIFIRAQHLQQLLERFLACRPTGAAKNNRIVAVALYPLVKESCQIYFDLSEILGIFIDRFMELQIPDCVKVYDIFLRLSKQFEDLDIFYNWCKTAGISRSSEYPDVERITPKKLEVMDDFIRDKSSLAQSKNLKTTLDPKSIVDDSPSEETDYDMTGIKALPAPEIAKVVETKQEQEEQPKETTTTTTTTTTITDHVNKAAEEVDFLNLGEEPMTGEEQGNKLALALFDGNQTAPQWEAFKDEESSVDWEMALVESASNLSNQKTELGGGFDMLLLDGMYSQAPQGGGGASGDGSASSVVAYGAAPAMLALPAPPVSGGGGGGNGGGDPFAASLVVPPPAYVQMSEMEKKQRLLVEEQMMWQQYARDGMQGKLPANPPYPMGGGYTQRF